MRTFICGRRRVCTSDNKAARPARRKTVRFGPPPPGEERSRGGRRWANAVACHRRLHHSDIRRLILSWCPTELQNW